MANSTSHALPYPIKNARFTLELPFRTSAGTPTDPTTPDTEFSTDGGATFADCAEEITTGGGNGIGYLTLTGAETNTNVLGIAGKSANCVTTPAVLYPKTLATVGSGTLSAGSAGGGTLGTVLAYDVTGCFIRTTGGTGGGGTGGANNQARRIVTYNVSTGAFTVSPNWETTPDNTTTYDVLLPEGVTMGMLKALNPTTAGRTLDVSTGGEAGLDWANVGSPTTTLGLTNTTVGIVTTASLNMSQSLPSSPIDDTAGQALKYAATGVTVTSIGSGAISSNTFVADAIDANAIATSAAAEIAAKVWAQTMTELSTVPGVTGETVLNALTWLLEMHRNKRTQTSATETLYKDDGSTALSTSTKSDDGTVFTRGEYA